MAQTDRGSQGQRIQIKIIDAATGQETHSSETVIRPRPGCTCCCCDPVLSAVQAATAGAAPQQQ
jgi:hypothetical protein